MFDLFAWLIGFITHITKHFVPKATFNSKLRLGALNLKVNHMEFDETYFKYTCL